MPITTDAVTEAQQTLNQLTATITRAQEELAEKWRTVHSAEAAYRQAEEARLSGQTNGGTVGDLRRQVVSARVERDALLEVLESLRAQHASATVALHKAQQQQKTAEAVQRFNQLAEVIAGDLRRLHKGCRELVSSLDALQGHVMEQSQVADAAGYRGMDWVQWSRRILYHYTLNQLGRLPWDFPRPNDQMLQQLGLGNGTAQIWHETVCPFTQRLAETEDA